MKSACWVIARAKRLGLSLDQIRSLVDGWRQDDCRSTRDQLAASVEARLADVRHVVAAQRLGQ